jgi:hypothetical protein
VSPVAPVPAEASRVCAVLVLAMGLASAQGPASAQAGAGGPTPPAQVEVSPPAANGPGVAMDEATLKAELRRRVDAHRRRLLPEYERRVKADGRDSADRWLRAEATAAGRLDAQELRARGLR